MVAYVWLFFFFSSRRRHTRCLSDWSSDVCSSDLALRRRESRPDPRTCLRGPHHRQGDCCRALECVGRRAEPALDAAAAGFGAVRRRRSEEHTSELQSLRHLVCRLLLEKKKTKHISDFIEEDSINLEDSFLLLFFVRQSYS